MSATLKRLNRADLTKRLVAKLKHDEAVVAVSATPTADAERRRTSADSNFYMLGSMGLDVSDRAWRGAGAAAKIDDKPGPIQTPRKPALIRNRFMKGLGSSRDGALDA